MASETEELFRSCIRCGLCLAVCPSYRETLNETDSPRGRVALARAAAEDGLEPGSNYADKFFRCLLCASCENICPSGVVLAELLQETRDDIAARDLLPQRLAELDAAIAANHNVSGEGNAQRLMWADNLQQPPSGLDRERAEIAYFVGCVGSFFPRSYSVPRTFVEILERAQVDYALLGDEEWCCGYPQFINGELGLAEEAIHHNVEKVRELGAQRVAFTCPSCYHIWKHVYPGVLGEELGLELLHATELLDQLIAQGAVSLRPFPRTVTYHDPCDLGRKSGVYDAPRRILQRIPELVLVEMDEIRENAHCCGGGGNLESHNPELAGRIAERRVRQAAQTGADTIVSACQQCERTLSGAARSARLRMRVMDISEIVLQAMER
jgi:heterodisulfide reductase subunit D